jgi:hypothetical protein
MDDNKKSDPANEKEKAKEFVRSILTKDFKQKVDDALIEDVAIRVLKALPPR